MSAKMREQITQPPLSLLDINMIFPVFMVIGSL
jgi:hypothetical protein